MQTSTTNFLTDLFDEMYEDGVTDVTIFPGYIPNLSRVVQTLAGKRTKEEKSRTLKPVDVDELESSMAELGIPINNKVDHIFNYFPHNGTGQKMKLLIITEFIYKTLTGNYVPRITIIVDREEIDRFSRFVEINPIAESAS